MNRSSRLLPLFLFILLGLLIQPAHAVAPVQAVLVGPGDIYLALGDSLATGYEVVDNGQPGYPTWLHSRLQALRPGLTLENFGQSTATGDPTSGETSSSFLLAGGQLERAEAFIAARRAEGKVVSPVTLTIGGNDTVGLILPGSSAELTQTLTLYRANLRQILDRLVAALSDQGQLTGDLLIANYYNPYPRLYNDIRYQQFLRINPDVEMPKFNQMIAEEAAARGIPVVDLYTAFAGREPALILVASYNPYPPPTFDQELLRRNLDFHPSVAGHQVIASEFWRTGRFQPVYVPMVAR